MRLSEAIRKQLDAWRTLREIDAKLEKKGLSIEFDEVYEPGTELTKFRSIRVVIDVKKALPSLRGYFTDSDLPFPIDPASPHDGSQPEFFDVGGADDELSSILGFDPTDMNALDEYIRKNAEAGEKGFDVVTAQPTKEPYRPGELHPSAEQPDRFHGKA